MKKLNPEIFMFENYIGRVGYSPRDVLGGGYLQPGDKIQPGVRTIGYCNASRLKVRPRNAGFALMVEMQNGDRVWLHVDTLPGVTAPEPVKRLVPSGSYTVEQFNEAYCKFRFEQMGMRKAIEDYAGIMRAWRGLLHVYLNTERTDKKIELVMQALQLEFGMRMSFIHGPDWVVKEFNEDAGESQKPNEGAKRRKKVNQTNRKNTH